MDHDFKPHQLGNPRFPGRHGASGHKCTRCGGYIHDLVKYSRACVDHPEFNKCPGQAPAPDTNASKGEALDLSDDSTRARAELVAGLTDDKASVAGRGCPIQ